MIVREATTTDDYGIWARFLARLHTDADEAEFLRDIPTWVALSEPMVCFLAFDPAGEPIGMIDARERNYAEGAPNLRAAYVEDLWVEPAHRRQGVARGLLQAVEQWARDSGLDWLGSDTQSDNRLSLDWHVAVGFHVEERAILFGKALK